MSVYPIAVLIVFITAVWIVTVVGVTIYKIKILLLI